MSNLYYDQYDYQIDNDPYPILKRLRDEAPVWYNQKYDFWLLSRYEDVLNASKDHDTYSSAWGTVLELMPPNPGESTAIINNDPPYHSQLRRLVASRFSPRYVAALENEIREIVVRYLKPLEGQKSFDFVQDFCRWIPMEVVSALLGVPQEDRKKINTWGDEILHSDEGKPEESEICKKAREGLLNYAAAAIHDRRANPKEDLMSLIAFEKIRLDDGSTRPLTDQEAAEYIFLLAAAGNETVARLLANSSCYLSWYPEQRQMLRDDPSLIPQAVEELLRFDPPSPIQFRRTLKDVELHGVTIPAGSNVALSTAAAARDERRYKNPDTLDFSRKERHLSLGEGVHTCLGAHVARLEIRIAIEELLKRFPDWTVDESGLQRVRTSTVRGYCNVPFRVAN
jgi:cytochrome P450